METTAAKYAHYLRVSTDKQGIEGYGIDAQRAAIMKYIPAVEFIEVESGKRKDRPELLKALEYCKKNKAVLVVAKLDRLSRNVLFVSTLQESKVEFICADMPEASILTIQFMAVIAQHEAAAVSVRTKAALKAARVRGVVLGKSMSTDKAIKGHTTQTDIADRNALKVLTTISGLNASGMSLRAIAQELNTMGVVTPRKAQWTAQAVKNAINRSKQVITI
jgi:DNA invertase Pin-like site-specific DNA recombinase